MVALSSGSQRVQLTSFRRLVDAHQGQVYAIALAITGDRRAAEDLAQETFLCAWTKRAQLRDADKAAPWLAAIVRNQARNWRRKYGRRARHEQTVTMAAGEPAAKQTPLDELLASEDREQLLRTVMELPESYRVPLVLFYEGEQSVAEVASTLKLSVPTVKKRLSRGRHKLASTLTETMTDGLSAGALRFGKRASFTAGVLAAIAGVPSADAAQPGSTSPDEASQTLGSADTAGQTASSGVGLVARLRPCHLVTAIGVATVAALWLGTGGESDLAGDSGAPIASKRVSASLRPEQVRADGAATGAPGTLSLSGVVVDDSDAPVAFAEVSVGERTVRAGEDGYFSVSGLWPQVYAVRARHGDKASDMVRLSVRAQRDPIELMVTSASKVDIAIVDTEGKPVAGAKLTWESRGVGAQETFIAGRDGVVHLRGISVASYSAAASAPGYAQVGMTVRASGLPQTHHKYTLTMQPGVSTRGRVVTTHGDAVAGAKVVAVPARSPATGLGKPAEVSALAGADGEFELQGLAPNTEYNIEVGAEGFGTVEVPYQFSSTADLLAIELREAIPIHGRVVDTQGQPVAGVAVQGWAAGGHAASAYTDGSGRFSFRCFDSGSVSLFLAQPGKVAGSVVSLDETPVAEVELRLGASQIHGVVRNLQGEPVEGARVMGIGGQIGDQSGGWMTHDVTDTSGRFTLARARLGPYVLKVRGPTQSRLHLRLTASHKFTHAADSAPVEVILQPASNLSFRVVDDSGAPITRAFVALGSRSGRMPRTTAAFSTTDGRITLKNIPAGTHILHVAANGSLAYDKEFRAEAGQPVKLGTVMLQPGRTITGLVTDDAGAPIAGARVFAGTSVSEHSSIEASLRAGVQTTTTDVAGAFVLTGLAGDVRLWARYRGQRGEVIESTGGSSAVIALRIGRPGRLVGTVLVPDEKQAGARLRAYAASLMGFATGAAKLDKLFEGIPITPVIALVGIDNHANRHQTAIAGEPDADGRYDYELGDIPAGRYEVVLESPFALDGDDKKLSERYEVEIRPGGTTTLDLHATQ